jgi:hypothetical protein
VVLAVVVQVVAVVAWVSGWFLAFGVAGGLVAVSLPVFALGFELERRR